MERTVLNHAIGRGNEPICGESDALFPWWSVTKTVFAAAVLRLADSGRLSLDNFYRDRPYTIRQLLQHTAGLNTYGGPPYRAAVAAGDPVWPVAELLARVKADRLVFNPGEGWAYSNVGYLFVRELIEETVDMEIDESLRALVFEPMGIQRTRIVKTPDDMAQTHWGNPNGYDPRWVYHGLLIGPPSDAVHFLRQLLSEPFLSKGAASAPLHGSDRLPGQRGLLHPGFQRGRRVAGHDYNSDWTPLLAGLSPAGMAARASST